MALKLRTMTTLSITAMFIILVLLLYTLTTTIFLGEFDQLEEDEVEEHVHRVNSAIDSTINGMDGFNRGWASWNETFEFVQNGTQAYIDANLVDTTFASIPLNFMLFYNITDHLVFSKAYNTTFNVEVPVTQSLHDYIGSNPKLLNHTTVDSFIKGMILLPEDPVLISSRPVTNFGFEPIGGTLIIGRFLDQALLNTIAGTVHLTSSIERTDRNLSEDSMSAIVEIGDDDRVLIETIDDDSIAGYSVIRDINKQPALLVHVEQERALHKEGQDTISYFLIFIILMGLVSAFAAGVMLDLTVVRPIKLMTGYVGRIGKGDDPDPSITVTGVQELIDLSDEINALHEDRARAEGLYQYLNDMSPNLNVIIDERGRIQGINKGFLGALGYSMDEVVGRRIDEFIAPEQVQDAMESLKRDFTGDGSVALDINLKAKDGAVHTIMTAAGGTQFLSELGEPRILITGTDVTVRKQIEDDLERSNAEKEILIREVHHRVKNNLQIIMSIMQLQSDLESDMPIEERLAMVKSRVKSMAFVHEMLYKAKEISSIDLCEYLESLGSHLMQTSGPGDSSIELTVEGGHIPLKIDQAVNCGLIVNELILNSIKHAFPDGTNGKITVILDRSGDSVEISVSDDGAGIPEDMDITDTDTLGLLLVNSLVEQLDGTLELDRTKGTMFVIRFPIGSPKDA